MKCIVVDDDKLTRVLVEKYIKKTKILELVGSYENPVEAMNDKDMEDIDLIFIDIEMPEMTGIEFMQSFKILPLIIVISAKEKYVLNALDLDAVDYILKPIEYPRFLKAVNKAKDINESIGKKEGKGIFIKDGGTSFIRLKYDEVLWVEALENYVLIVTEDNRHTIHFTMKSLEQQLPGDFFIRIHRSYIVNVDKIVAIEDNYVIIIYNGRKKSFPIAKSFREKLLKKIKIISK